MSKKMIHDLAINYIEFCATFGEKISYPEAVKLVKMANS